MSSIGEDQEQFARQMAARRGALVNQYLQALHDAAFSNRSDIRPAMLGRIAESEADALIAFIEKGAEAVAEERGRYLGRLGMSDQSVLQLCQTGRQFIVAHAMSDAGPLPLSLSQADAYQKAVMRGFIRGRESLILQEQERIRSALEKTLSRYAVQMELAAGVAWATNSIMDLDALLTATVDLIRQRFELYYVGVFLLDETGGWAFLRAGSAANPLEAEELPLGTAFDVTDRSLLGQCLSAGKPHISQDVSREAELYRSHLLPSARAVIALPLLTRGRVIGALVAQSQRPAAFTEQDATALNILADQLANAIENARLFSQLQQSEEKYRTILEAIEEGYYETDLDGLVTFANTAACAILGCAPDKVQGLNCRKLATPEYATDLDEAFTQVYQTGRAVKGLEFKIVRPDETDRFVEIYIALKLDAAGQPCGFRGILRDVSRRKQAEQYLIERRALERSNRELEQFAYIASHDLQEPLRKIQAFGDRLKAKYAVALGEDGQDYLGRMLNACERMQNLINDLLTLSRVKTKAQPFTTVDLNQIIREVLDDLETRIERTGGKVEVGEMLTIKADPLQMRQLFQNLIGNALKFHRPNVPPCIRISSEKIRERRALRGLGCEELCLIRIEDNGIGFDEQHLDRIFQPFQRLHGRNEYEGTGIGLSICRTIVERHGGHITARSKPGEGATFFVTLPLSSSHQEVALENSR